MDLYGEEVANDKLAKLPDVPPGETEVVSLPVSLNLLQMGAAVITAIQKKDSVEVDLGATVDVVPPFGTVPLDVKESKTVDLQ
jgi:hypothetical protein